MRWLVLLTALAGCFDSEGAPEPVTPTECAAAGGTVSVRAADGAKICTVPPSGGFAAASVARVSSGDAGAD